jgi:hypothetical protein
MGNNEEVLRLDGVVAGKRLLAAEDRRQSKIVGIVEVLLRLPLYDLFALD